MKKTFKKLLALFLTGTMLAGVGCKDYDDDIDNLQKEIDDLKSQIELKADASALKSLQEKIDGIDFASFVTKTELSQELAKYVTDTELSDALADYVTTSGLDAKIIELGYLKQSEIQSLIDDKFSSITNWTKEDIEAIFDAQIALYDIWHTIDSEVAKAIQDALDGYEISQANIDAVISAVVGMINAETSDVHSALMNLLGQEFAKELVNYVTVDQLAGYVKTDEIGNIIKDYNYVTYQDVETTIIDKLGKEGEDLTQKIQGLIDDSISNITDNDSAANVTKDNITWLETNDLKAVFEEYDKQIAAIWSAIGDLASRIQSLVYVPAYADGKVIFPSSYTIAMTNDQSETSYFFLGAAEKQQAELKFRISPASLATESKINKETLSIVTEEVMTRAENAEFTIDEVKDWNPAAGTFVVVASTDYNYSEAQATEQKTLAIALHVAIDNKAATEENQLQGIEYTTAFIPTEGGQAESINGQLAVARLVDDKYEALPDNYTTELEFTDKSVQNFFEGYTVVLKQNDELMALNSVWKNVPEFELVAPESVATVTNSHEDNYDLTETTAAIVTPAPALVNDVITSGNFTFRLKDQNGNYADIKTAAQKIKVIAVDTEVAATQLDAPVVWSYAAAAGNKEYTSEIEFTNKLAFERFNGLADLTPTFTVTDAAGKAVENINVSVVSYSTPSADTDVQRMTLKFVDTNNQFIDGGNYIVKAVYTETAAGTTVTVESPIAVEGLPAVPDQIYENKHIAYQPNKNAYIVFEDFAQIIWNAWGEEVATKYFEDYNTFKSALSGKTFTTNSDEEDTTQAEDNSKIYIGTVNIAVSFRKSEVPYELYGKLATSWGLEVVFGGTFTLDKPQGVLLQRGSDLPENNRVLIATTLSNGTFAVDNKNLQYTYFYDGGVEGVNVKFAIKPNQDIDYGTASVSGNELSWGSYTGLELPIVVTLEDNNGVVFDSQEFVAYILDPIKDQVITTKEGKVEATTTEQTLKISSLLTLNDMNGKNVFGVYTEPDNGVETTGLLTPIKQALDAKVSYSKPDIIYSNRIKFDETTGTLTVLGSTDTEMANTETISIDVTFTYKYGVERKGTVKVVVAQK